MKKSEIHYSIMPDYGMAYAWINRGGEYKLGGNCANVVGWAGDHCISDKLHKEFAKWQTEFERAQVDQVLDIPLLDWVSYHKRGLALTQMLKGELKDEARVFYVKPYEDPNVHEEECIEVLNDGICIEIDHVSARGLGWLPKWFPKKKSYLEDKLELTELH